MAKTKRKSKSIKREFISPFKNYWTKKNYILLGLCIGILIIGFYLMSVGSYDNHVSLTFSPLVLLVAYFIIFPLSILLSNKKQTVQEEDDSSKSNG